MKWPSELFVKQRDIIVTHDDTYYALDVYKVDEDTFRMNGYKLNDSMSYKNINANLYGKDHGLHTDQHVVSMTLNAKPVSECNIKYNDVLYVLYPVNYSDKELDEIYKILRDGYDNMPGDNWKLQGIKGFNKIMKLRCVDLRYNK